MELLKVGVKYVHTLRFFSKSTQSVVMKYLNVAEKNDAAKNIAAILSRGASTRREGFSQYNKIYEFNATVLGQQAQMVMTSVSGHLLNYEFAATFRNWKSCNPVALFDAPVVKSCPEDYQRIKRTLEREIRSCQGLIIWTDCDREGENIGFEIIQVCLDVKPNLNVYRARFSEITATSVFRALNDLQQPNRNISDAVDVRQELDLRTGAAFTRLQTLRFQRVFPETLADKLISYGSCQFPTLGFVVERYKAIEEFIAEQFWKLHMSHSVKDMTTEFTWKRGRLFDKEACEAFLDICQENPTATVELVENKPKNKWRPVPLDTIEMEKNVSKKLKINAKDCMKIAEKLYTQGLISYPRTETNIFPKELNLNQLVELQRNDERWGPFAHRVLNEGGCTPRQGKKSDQAHPPIHPTKYSNSLTGNEQRLYEYIVRHFLACVHKDAKGFETTVHVDVAGEKFTAKGLVVLERNYLDVYIYERWTGKEIYGYENGDTFQPTVLEMIEGSTSPPSLLTEADLITLMDKHGIGTDATHAEHIETIKSREYVGLHENIYFVPGTLGMGLVEGYNNIGLEVSLAKPLLRSEFENDLKLICEGRKDPEAVRTEQIEKYKAVFRAVLEQMAQIDQTLANRLNDAPQQFQEPEINQEQYKSVLKCPKCGSDMILRKKKNGDGKYLGCVGFPGCKNSVWFAGYITTIEVLDESCETCGPNVKKLKIKFRHNPFYGDPNPKVLCIGGCDTDVLETLDISLASVRNRTEPNANVTVNNRDNNNVAAPVQNNLNNRVRGNAANVPAPVQNNLNNWIRGNNAPNNNFGAAANNTSFANQNDHPNHQRPGNFANRGLTDNYRNTNDGGNTRNSLDTMPGPSRDRNGSFNNSTLMDSTANGNNATVCLCNQDAILLTVKKDGPNKGRKFYKCQQGKDNGGCDFFLWGDAEDAASTSAVQRPSNELTCSCNLNAVLRTVSKDGPNKGRQFYCCPKPIAQGCKFFKWADEVDNAGGNFGGDDDDNRGGGGGFGNQRWNGNNTFGGRGRGNYSWKGKGRGKGKANRTAPYNNQTKAKRKCGLCGEEGHIRTNCPNK